MLPQILADQLTLFQPEGQIMPYTLLLAPPPPRFLGLPTVIKKLYWRQKLRMKQTSGVRAANLCMKNLSSLKISKLIPEINAKTLLLSLGIVKV